MNEDLMRELQAKLASRRRKKISNRYDFSTDGIQVHPFCRKFGHMPELSGNRFYEIVLRNPKDPDEFVGRIYEEYLCERCKKLAGYDLFCGKKKPFRGRISLVEQAGIYNVHTRGEVYV